MTEPNHPPASPPPVTPQAAADRAVLIQSYVNAIVETSDDAIYTRTLDGTVATWNRGAERIFGYRAGEIVGRSAFLLIPPDRLKEEEKLIERLLKGERVEHVETVRVAHDGRIIDVSLTVSPVRDATGRIVGAAKILRDITDQKRAERALRDSEIRNRAILEASLDGIITIDDHGLIESINPTGQRLFGYAAAEVVGQNISMLMPQPYRGEHDGYLHHYRTTGRRRIIGIGREVVGLRKDGTTFPMELSVSELNLSGRRVFTGNVHDITARKRAEQALKESEQRFRTIADAIPQLMWTTGPAGAVDYCNARWYQYTGLSLEQTRTAGWKAAIHPDDADAVLTAWAGCLMNGAAYDGECRFKRGSDGVYRWFLMRGVPVRDSAGDIVQWIGTCTDIDEQKRAREIEAARIEAETANRAKSEFLANMSHEIRTPMTAILGYADLLLDPDQTVSDRHNAVNVIRRNGAHLLTIINDILDLSKIEAGEMKIERIPCSPCRIIAEVTSLIRVRAKEAGLSFTMKADGRIPETIQTDPTRLRQILINLLGNAVKFTEAGWVRLVAKLLDPPESPNPRMRFEVIDSGIGMSPDQVGRLFQPFGQADTSTTRRFGGTGLGLTISQRLARELGGEITVDSMLGRGSLFAVTIVTGPLHGVRMLEDCSEVLEVLDHSATPPATGPVHLEGRILLAEDGIDNQTLLSAYLRKAGAQVVIAENGRIACQHVAEAMRISGEAGFDLILMDMQMPELDGYGATAKLRSMGFRGPIVALTANAMATDRDRCLQAGCTDYLSKPVKRDELLATVQRYLTEASLRPRGAPPAAASRAGAAQPPEGSSGGGGDDILRRFRPQYISHLPQDVYQLEASLAGEDLAELRELAHRIAGTAGMYGFMDLSKAATVIEKEIISKTPFAAVAPKIRALVAEIRSVPGYDPEKEQAGAAGE